jgi:hypothetical protein
MVKRYAHPHGRAGKPTPLPGDAFLRIGLRRRRLSEPEIA